MAAAAEKGIGIEPMLFPEGTKTAHDAAAAVGCDISAIVKSLVFMVDERPVLVLMAGDKRVDLGKLSDVGQGTVRRATLDEVKASTGYTAGGTPPFGHTGPVRVVADESLRRNGEVWAAAGTPTAVFSMDVDELAEAADAEWVSVAAS